MRLSKLYLLAATVALLGAAATEALRQGDEAALCGGRRFPVATAPGGASPYVALGADGVAGQFLLDYGATKSSVSARAFAGPEGSVRRLQTALPGFEAAPFELRASAMPLAPAGGKLGVVGTDLLSVLTVQLSPDAAYIGRAPCAAAAMRQRGFAPISQAGFFGSVGLSEDQHHITGVADELQDDERYPNVPVVYMSIGGVHAFAQLDTGYDDLVYAHSVDVNQPLFDRLIEAGLPLEPVASIEVATCEGRERRAVYRVRDQALVVEDEKAVPLKRIVGYHLILKPANGCGGIASMRAPAGQFGASFLKDFQTIVFDPATKTVWLAGAAKLR
jgi:hypothetical protein